MEPTEVTVFSAAYSFGPNDVRHYVGYLKQRLTGNTILGKLERSTLDIPKAAFKTATVEVRRFSDPHKAARAYNRFWDAGHELNTRNMSVYLSNGKKVKVRRTTARANLLEPVEAPKDTGRLSFSAISEAQIREEIFLAPSGNHYRVKLEKVK